jgi:hypothetical protein
MNGQELARWRIGTSAQLFVKQKTFVHWDFVVPHLGWDAGTGKFRRLVSLVGPPEDLHHAQSVVPNQAPGALLSRA